MQCTNCKTELSFSFKHAFSRNECPACGKEIMDEESLALLEDMKGFLLSEATIREETAHKLAMSLIAKYSISLRDGFVVPPREVKDVREENIKIALPSTISKQIRPAPTKAPVAGVVTAEQLMVEGISDSERERIADEAIREKYAMVDSMQATSFDSLDANVDVDFNQGELSVFTEGAESMTLEQDRRARLMSQQNVINGGLTKYGKPGSFRRS
jgi:hypothetical protein